MDLLGATTSPDTVILILLPSIGMLIALLGVLIAGFPIWKQHQKNLGLQDMKTARAKATEDAVLGTAADPNTGKPATRGLQADMSDLVKAVGQMNGTGKSLVEMAEQGLHVATSTASLLDTHTKQDDRRFGELTELVKTSDKK